MNNLQPNLNNLNNNIMKNNTENNNEFLTTKLAEFMERQ